MPAQDFLSVIHSQRSYWWTTDPSTFGRDSHFLQHLRWDAVMAPSRLDEEPLGRYKSRTRMCSCFSSSEYLTDTYAVDLPMLRNEPSYEDLLKTLNDLELPPTSWSETSFQDISTDAKSVSRYLLSIISSDLKWLEKNDHESELVACQKDELWELASRRLVERCGRSGKFVQLCEVQVPGYTHFTPHQEAD